MLDEITVMEQLATFGSEQTVKTYRKHGVSGDAYGVKYGDLKPLAKKIKRNHALALQLWATGNHDARILATMIADPNTVDEATVDSWVASLDNYVMSDAVATFIMGTPMVKAKAEQWMPAEGEWTAYVGWLLLSHLALNDSSLPDSYFEAAIATIERDIHQAKNRVRHAMNNALISIGMRNPALESQAVAAAQRIGKVVVDHGETNCKTPDAISYIHKAKDRKTAG